MFNNNEKSIIQDLAQNAIVTNRFNQEAAIKAIELFLSKKPDEASKQFFAAFRNEIASEQDGGFSYRTLQSKIDALHTARSNKGYPALFDHWWDAKSSPAARCIQELYTLATGERLTKQEKEILVTDCTLPEKKPNEQTAFYEKHIEKLINQPLGYPNNRFKQVTLAEYLQRKAASEEPLLKAQIERAKEQRRVEAAYQQVLLTKATAILAQKNSSTWQFDPQGHVLVEVPALAADELDKISRDVKVRAALNVDPKRATLCSVDALAWDGGKDAFLQWITGTDETSSDTDPVSETLQTAIETFINRSLGSVIPLQENMSFHLWLITRVLQSKIGGGDEDIWNTIIQKVTASLNKEIRLIYQQALIEGYKNGVIDLGLVNTKLDEARPVLVKKCHELLKQNCVTRPLNQPNLLSAIQNLKDKDFTQITATGKDYVRFDAADQASYRMTRTDETAHGKKYGKDQAFRLIHTAHYQPETGAVSALDRDLHCIARVPSIAQLKPDKSKGNIVTRFFKGLIKIFSHKESVADVVVKLSSAYAQLQAQLGGYDGPMTYNLLTSLHSKFWDFTADRGNYQRASAARILYGAHVFNAEQIKAEKPNSLLFVQNIPVNQHTNSLSYDSSDGATREATLMTDIALLSTLTQHAKLFPKYVQDFLEENNFKIMQEYRWFLNNHRQGNLYFNNTPRAGRVMAQLDFIKSELNNVTFVHNDNTTLLDLATQALLKLYGSNTHWNKQFGMLTQSLSVFVERAAQVGCKSAIDRAKGVLGRVLMLEALDKRPLDTTHSVVKALQNFAKGETKAEELQRILDTQYGNTSLDRLPISPEDNGGDAKLRASTNPNGGALGPLEINTNIGESPYLKEALKANHTRNMQAQKAELPQRFKKLFSKTAVEGDTLSIASGMSDAEDITPATTPARPGNH